MKNSVIRVGSLVLMILISRAAPASAPRQGDWEAHAQIIKWALSKNTLIHIAIPSPKRWKLGADNDLQIKWDIPFEEDPTVVDYAAFNQRSSRSCIFVAYKPILGASFFGGDPKKFAEWFKAAHVKVYQSKEVPVVEGSLESWSTTVGGKTFYVIKNEILTLAKARRAVILYLHIPDDMKSLYMFGFSTPAAKGIEAGDAFQSFMKIVGGFVPKKIDEFEEILYRQYAAHWTHPDYQGFIDVGWENAIKDEIVEGLKHAVAMKPDRWESHYLLAKQYSSPYLMTLDETKTFWGDKVVIKDGEMWQRMGNQLVKVWDPQRSRHPMRAEAAIEEYKYLINLNPKYITTSKWVLWPGQNPPSLKEMYIGLIGNYAELGKYDEAVAYMKDGVARLPSSFFNAGSWGLFRTEAKEKEQLGEYDSALAYYGAVLTIDEGVLAKLESKEPMTVLEARPDIEIRERLADIIEIGEKLAEIYVKKGMKREAINEYSRILDLATKNRWEKKAKEIEAKLRELEKR